MEKELVELLAMVAGALLSLAVELPFFQRFYGPLTGGQKRLVMAGMLLLSSLVIYGATCAGLLSALAPGLFLACTQEGLATLVRALLLALVSNQGVYSLAFRGRKKKTPVVS